MSQLRHNWGLLQPLADGYSDIRVTVSQAQSINEGYPKLRHNTLLIQPIEEGYSVLRTNYYFVQALFNVLPELPMSTEPFPGFGNKTGDPTVPAGADPFNSALPGLAFSVHKKPMFKTHISEGAAGNEVRNALMQYPRWDFELTYEFLEDRSGANSSLKTIMGFFLARQGSYDSWLFKDPDDYQSVDGYCGTADGTITEFPLCRDMGSFSEKVGQLDMANPLSVTHKITENQTIPAMGPYTVTVTNAAAFAGDYGVTKAGTPMTKVTGAPAAGQYAVNTTTGVYTFAAADAGAAIVITYSYTISSGDYTVRQPNLIVFSVAPAAGDIHATFQFFYACRFVDDQVDFEKFVDKLWSLQSCNFRSIIQ